MGDTADPTDHFRTTCPHAGEFFIDRLCWPGLLAIVLGVASLVGGVASAAYGHQGWTLPFVGLGIPAIGAGLAWLALEHRRVINVENLWRSAHSARRAGLR